VPRGAYLRYGRRAVAVPASKGTVKRSVRRVLGHHELPQSPLEPLDLVLLCQRGAHRQVTYAPSTSSDVLQGARRRGHGRRGAGVVESET
jgi:hypothetical protein